MPLLRLTTNLEMNKDHQQAAATALSAVVARMLGKPESYVMSIVQSGQTMLFAGSDQICAYVELKSLGLPEARTAEFSATLCDLIEENLGIDPARIYIDFSSPPRHMWGWDKNTF